MSYGEHSGDDAAFGRQVAANVDLNGRVVAGQAISNVRIARGLVERSQCVAALSYHFQVFAMAAARPFLCLISGPYYAHKGAAIQGWLDPSMRLSIDLDAPRAAPEPVCDHLHARGAVLSQHLRDVGREIRNRQRAFAERLASLSDPVEPTLLHATESRRAAA
jgi:hypothetical protein